MARSPKFDDDEVLDRAMKAFWEGGWTRTSIRDLEDALELKAPSIYRRFGTKEGLGVAVVDHYVDRVVERRVRTLLHGDGDPIANIRRFLETSVTESGDGGRLWGCLLTTMSLEADECDAEVTVALQRGLEAIEAGIGAEMRRAAASGRLPEGVTPEAATASATLAMQGLMALSRSGMSSVELRARARQPVEVFTR